MRTALAIALVLLQFVAVVRALHASEYLGNNQRTGHAEATVPPEPALLWTYNERHPPRRSWPDPKHEVQFIDYDYADQVTTGAGMVFFGSSADHTVRALDVDSGKGEMGVLHGRAGTIRAGIA